MCFFFGEQYILRLVTQRFFFSEFKCFMDVSGKFRPVCFSIINYAMKAQLFCQTIYIMHLYMLYIKPDERRKTFGSSKKKTAGLKGLCHPTRMREPMKTNLKKSAHRQTTLCQWGPLLIEIWATIFCYLQKKYIRTIRWL